MYTYFNRFLHHILSHSDVKPQLTPMLSYSGLTRISRWGKFANCFDLDHRVKPDGDRKGKDASLKPDGDSLCAGRSMVEMLGVLAIIGVLSVGAIAGYSKAMMKYKLNKHTESFRILLNEAIKLRPDVERLSKSYDFNELLYKANLLPDGINYNASDTLLYDIFKNKNDLYYLYWTRPNGTLANDYVLETKMNRSGNKISSQDKEICRNIMLAAKENFRDINSIEMRSDLPDDRYYNASSFSRYSLSKATLKQIDDACSSCDSELSCEIILYIRIKNQ